MYIRVIAANLILSLQAPLKISQLKLGISRRITLVYMVYAYQQFTSG